MSCLSTKNVRAERIGMLCQCVYRTNGLLSDTEPNPPLATSYGQISLLHTPFFTI